MVVAISVFSGICCAWLSIGLCALWCLCQRRKNKRKRELGESATYNNVSFPDPAASMQETSGVVLKVGFDARPEPPKPPMAPPVAAQPLPHPPPPGVGPKPKPPSAPALPKSPNVPPCRSASFCSAAVPVRELPLRHRELLLRRQAGPRAPPATASFCPPPRPSAPPPQPLSEPSQPRAHRIALPSLPQRRGRRRSYRSPPRPCRSGYWMRWATMAIGAPHHSLSNHDVRMWDTASFLFSILCYSLYCRSAGMLCCKVESQANGPNGHGPVDGTDFFEIKVSFRPKLLRRPSMRPSRIP